MKKIVTVLLVMALVVCLTVPVIAAPAAKIAAVSLSASATTVEIGKTVTLTASTLKQGSDYSDGWTGAQKGSTALNSDGYYVSTATFNATTVGTYTVVYGITMSAGKSGVTFNGNQSVTITVIDPAKIVGAAVKNVVATPRYNPNDKIIGYDATADVYAVWSDGKEILYGTTSFNFSENQTSRNIDVTVEGVTYTVNVTRN